MGRPSAATPWLLIRHAESVWNASGRWQGQGDPPLSADGSRQAEALARELAGREIEVLYASDLARAAETAAILAARLELVPRLEARLRERDLGQWTGLTGDEIEARAPGDLARVRALDPDVRPGGGESSREVGARARAAVEEIAKLHAGRRVAVVTHLGVIRALLPGTELANAGWCLSRLDGGRLERV
jgi:probable phosphoglycerate mutase